jgi:hypothetical protein
VLCRERLAVMFTLDYTFIWNQQHLLRALREF